MVYNEDNRKTLTSFLLRAGLCVVFLYAGISALFNPENWIGFVPQLVSVFIPRDIFLVIHGITDLVIGIWLISNFKPFWAGLVASLSLIAIILFNFVQLEIIFRDIAILFAALALMALTYRKK